MDTEEAEHFWLEVRSWFLLNNDAVDLIYDK